MLLLGRLLAKSSTLRSCLLDSRAPGPYNTAMTRAMSRVLPLAGLLAALFAATVEIRAWRGDLALARGREAQRRGDINTAIDLYGLALASGSADAAIERAHLHMRRRDWDATAAGLRKALSLAPAKGSAHVLLVKLEVQRPGPWDREREERVLGGCRSALVLALVQSGPRRECAGVFVELVRHRRDAWDPGRTRAVLEEAADGYHQAMRLEPRAGSETLKTALALSGDPAFLALVVVRRGGTPGIAAAVNLLLERGLWLQAETAFWVAAARHGLTTDLAAAAADALARKGGIREALAAVRRGLSVEPENPALTGRLKDFSTRLASAERAFRSGQEPGRGAP